MNKNGLEKKSNAQTEPRKIGRKEKRGNSLFPWEQNNYLKLVLLAKLVCWLLSLDLYFDFGQWPNLFDGSLVVVGHSYHVIQLQAEVPHYVRVN